MPNETVVVVLGANCFSGQDFVDLLLDRPEFRVVGVSRSPERSDLFLKYRLRGELSRYTYRQMDLNHDMTALLALCDAERPAWIVDFAALSEVAPSWDNPDQWLQTNAVALAQLVNHLRTRDYLERFLYISTPEVYGTCTGTVTEDAPLNPSTPYAVSKAAADLLLETYRRQFGFPVLTVRATNVYGARQQLHKIIPRTAVAARAGRRVALHGGGRAVKSYIHIRDVSRGELAVLEGGRLGERYHLSPTEGGLAVRDLVRMIAERVGVPFDTLTETVDERPGQDAAYVICSEKASGELGWSPEIALSDGLDEVVDWVDSYWEAILEHPLDYIHRP